ncbi:hypothetical protein ABGB18_16375 [Nonomuraea sp. B12E4]
MPSRPRVRRSSGVLSADEGGAHIARQATLPDAPTGVFLNEQGGVHPW